LSIIALFSPIFCQVLINEYSASNLSWYTDNYQMEEDWIELYNTGSTDEDIGGYFLSDDSDEPIKHPLIEEIFSGKKGSGYFKPSN